MSLIIKSKFWNKSNNIIIDYSSKEFTKHKKVVKESGTIFRRANKLVFKPTGSLNTSENNSNDNTNYINEARLISLVSIEKKEGNNFIIDCGDWSKDLIEVMDQKATYFLYKGTTIDNFMKDKHRYHILAQGDIIKLGKIYLKVLHIKIKQDKKKSKTESNKGDSLNNKSENNSNNDEEVENNIEENDDNNNDNKSSINNNLIIENEQENKTRNRNKKNTSINKYATEAKRENFFKATNNKNINRSVILNQKLNLTKSSIDLNDLNDQEKFNQKRISKKHRTEKNPKKPNKKLNLELEIKSLKNKICRICLCEESNPEKNPLICPCICKGSMKYIHYLCLKNWLNLKVEAELGPINIEAEKPTITYNTNNIFCELCKTKLPDYVKHNGKLYNVTFYKPKYEQFIVLESIRDDNRRTKFIHIIPLNEFQMHRIGRLNNCDLSLPDSSISRVHCCLYIENSQLVLENNSKYGTKVLVQNQKIKLQENYPLCIETQNTYLKIYLDKPFKLFGCCGASTKSNIAMQPYQYQNQKGFDLFCSMVFKDNDEENPEDEDEKDENNNIINDINNNINNEDGEEEKKEKKIIDEDKNKINKNHDSDKSLSKNDKKEKNLININLNEDTKSNKEKKIKIKSKNKGIRIIDSNIKSKMKDNNSLDKLKLINEDLPKNEKENNNSTSKIDESKTNIKESNKEESNPRLKNSQGRNMGNIKKDKNNDKNKENKCSTLKTDINKITTQNDDCIQQIQDEEYPDKDKKDIINLLNNNEINTIKADLDNSEIKVIDSDSNQVLDDDNNNSKLNKCINLDKINNLSYRNSNNKEKINYSVVNNYESIFGLIPNEKTETSLLLAPRHNKNIKFGNFDIPNDNERITYQKNTNKIWDKFNWNFK